VTGVVLIARTSKAAQRLTRQFRENRVTKVYWAIVPTAMDPPEGTCVDWLRKHERHRRVEVSEPEHPQAKQARLSYRTLRRLGERSLLEIRLETGRKHQIRVQLAERSHPILGDRKYGSQHAFAHGIALHSRQLELEHPVRKTPLRFVAPLPDAWDRFRIPS
jgi:23S rRNA pseudouridine1911/1915/1917 synthase